MTNTTTTRRYSITNPVSGAELGSYEGRTEHEALEAMARDAGYSSAAEAADVAGTEAGELIVKEVQGTPRPPTRDLIPGRRWWS